MSPSIYRLLADPTVWVHLAYVLFVLAGFAAILLGILCRWSWVRNPYFRAVHLLMMLVVTAEALLGITCPLTTWEYELRRMGGESSGSGSFIGRLAHELLFFDAPVWVFTVGYCLFGGIILMTFLLAPPRLPMRKSSSHANSSPPRPVTESRAPRSATAKPSIPPRNQ